jgi:hypothetical protein
MSWSVLFEEAHAHAALIVVHQALGLFACPSDQMGWCAVRQTLGALLIKMR